MASADGRLVPAHLGQGAWNTTCTLRRCRHASTSARAAGHARAVALSSAPGYRCCGGGCGNPGAGVNAYHTAYTQDGGQHRAGGRMWVWGRGEGRVAPGEARVGAAVGDSHPMASGALRVVVPTLDQEHPALRGCWPRPVGWRLRRSGRGGGPGPRGALGGGRPRRAARHPSNPAVPPRGCRAIPLAEGLVERGP